MAYQQTLKPAALQLPDRHLLRAIEMIQVWSARARSRAHLREVDDHILDDIGLTRAQAIEEANKFFWQP